MSIIPISSTILLPGERCLPGYRLLVRQYNCCLIYTYLLHRSWPIRTWFQPVPAGHNRDGFCAGSGENKTTRNSKNGTDRSFSYGGQQSLMALVENKVKRVMYEQAYLFDYLDLLPPAFPIITMIIHIGGPATYQYPVFPRHFNRRAHHLPQCIEHKQNDLVTEPWLSGRSRTGLDKRKINWPYHKRKTRTG